jgi:predicted amidohydrolase
MSLIVDPWGLVLAQAQDMPTVICADIDLAQIERVRTQIPCLHHRHLNVYRWCKPLYFDVKKG